MPSLFPGSQSCRILQDQAGQGIQPDVFQQSICKKEGAKIIKTWLLLISLVYKKESLEDGSKLSRADW